MTTKQTTAIKEMVVNGGNATQAMLAAGYSPNTANTPSKLTESKAYKTLYAPLLKEHQVTINQYIKNIGDAMVHEKQNQFTGEIVPDMQTRLAGNKQAERFLFNESPKDKRITPEDLKELANASDEVELQSIVFKQGHTG